METVVIEKEELILKEWKGERVITFKDIDTVHRRKEGTARQSFYRNKSRFSIGHDYFTATLQELSNSGLHNPRDGGNPNIEAILLTESGYLMIVKTLSDDRAWDVQRILVDHYFHFKSPVKQLSPIDIMGEQIQTMQLMFQTFQEQQRRLEEIEDRLEKTQDEVRDLRQGLVDINTPLREQLTDLVSKYAKNNQVTYREAYNLLYKKLNSKFHVNIHRRASNRRKAGVTARKMDIVEELRLITPGIQIMKTLVGERTEDD